MDNPRQSLWQEWEVVVTRGEVIYKIEDEREVGTMRSVSRQVSTPNT